MTTEFPFPPPPSANPDDIKLDIYPLIRIFNNGKIKRFVGTATVPAGTDPLTGVQSKDVIISPEDELSVRLYLPKQATLEKKLPVLVYYHGGGFCVCSAWSVEYHGYLNKLSNEANVVVVSVNYRLAPEHPLPTAFEDSWTALKWVGTQSGSNSAESETWLIQYGDFNKVFLSGDSAGGNIVHHMAVRAGEECLPSLKLKGIIPVHPFFSGEELIGNESKIPKEEMDFYVKVWRMVYPGMSDLDDPVINPIKDLEKMRKIGCERVLVCVAMKDSLADRGLEYGEVLKKCGKDGLEVEVFKSEEMGHVFHIVDRNCVEAEKMMKKVAEFINAT